MSNVVMKKYPNFKIGFTTVNFSTVYQTNLADIKKLIDFAYAHNFFFIEIRDSQANLTINECKDIAIYADYKGVALVYAMGCGLLDPNFWEVFSRGIANAAVFNRLGVIRTAAAGIEMLNNPGKKYWNSTEFRSLVQIANKAANTAKMFGLQYVVENALEGLRGDGITTFGTANLFGENGANQNLGLQLDVANLFCTSRVPSNPADVEEFVSDNVEKVGYTHLKSSQNHMANPVLNGNELPFDVFLQMLNKNSKNYMAIELNQALTTREICLNHLKSIEYLEQNY